MLAAFVVMVFDVGWRLRKGLTAWLAPLDANWTEEQNLIKELRAFPVEVLGPLARRIKTEIQLNDRVGGRLLRLELLLNEACLGDRR